MEQSNRKVWRILLFAEAAILLLAVALRAANVLSFRLAVLPLLLLMFLALDAVLLAVRYDKRHHAEAAYRTKRSTLLILVLIALIASVPLCTNYLIQGHDIEFHLFRIEGVRDGLTDGQFPVRIHPNTLYGHGYANPEFYPELLLYFPALLRLSGFSVMAAYKIFLFFLNLLTAFFAYYACARIFRSVRIGLIGSAFYTLSLYRLVNLYTRAAIGEASAMAFLPLVAVGIYAILFDDTEAPAYRRAFLPLLIGMTGLLSTHLITCELTLPLLIVFCLVFFRRTFTGKRLLSIAAAAAGTALLSLAFLVPMLDFMGFDTYRVFNYSAMNLGNEAVNVAQLFPLLPNAVGESNATGLGAAGEMPLGVGFAFLAVLALYPALAGQSKQIGDATRRAARFCYIAALVLLLMSTNLFPWAALYNLGGIIAQVAGMPQFPWRLHALSTLLLTFVACKCFVLLPSVSNAPLRRAAALALSLLLFITCVAYTDRLVQDSPARFIHSNADLDQRRSVGDAEYLPEGTSGTAEYKACTPSRIGAGLTVTDFMRDGTTITFAAKNGSNVMQTADLPLIYYLGYGARDEAMQAIALTKGEAARIRVVIPAGYAGSVTVSFSERPLWRVAEAVTFVTALALVAWYALERRRHGPTAIVDYGETISVLESAA